MMSRSLEDFTRRREAEAAYERKLRNEAERAERNRFRTGSIRGLDAFYLNSQAYYQEADEEDSEEDESDEETNDEGEDSTSDTGSDHMVDRNVDIPSDTDIESDRDHLHDSGESDISSESKDMIDQEPTGPVPDEEDDPIKSFGQHGGDDLPNNQYDQQEIAKLMEFVADEADTLSKYMEAAKTSKIDSLQRLYADIGDEERYHMEQLLFAKAEITGEEYKPHDPDIRKEYEELIALGMDEGSAMSTAVDKVNLHITTVTADNDGKIEQAMTAIKEAYEEMERASLYAETLNLIMEHAESTGDYSLSEKVMYLYEESFYQEDVTVTTNNVYSREFSPFKTLIRLIGGIFNLFRKLVSGIKTLIEKGNHRLYAALEFIKNNGPGALFKDGVSLYFWNDRTKSMDTEAILYYANNAWWLLQDVIRTAKIRNGQYSNEALNIQRLFVPHDQKFVKVPPAVNCARNITSLDPVRTKVIVDKDNANGIAEIFFTSYDKDKEHYNSQYGRGGIELNPNGIDIAGYGNFFCILDLIAQTLTTATGLASNVSGELDGLASDSNSIWRKDPAAYKQATEWMQAVVKGLQTISKICVSDFKTMDDLFKTIQKQ